jgi:hypothetical protein
MKYAAFWRRFAALWIDLLIVIGISLAMMGAYHNIAIEHMAPQS